MDDPRLGSRRDAGATVDPMGGKLCVHSLGQLSEYVWLRFIHDRVHGIKTQAVEVIFLEPVKRIVDKEISNGAASGTVKINGIAPRCALARGKKLRSVSAKVIAFRSEVVVHHVQKHH